MMKGFTELSVMPSAWMLDAATLSAGRMDASFYSPLYLRERYRLESIPYPIRDFRAICGKLNCGATPQLVSYGGTGVPLIRTSNVRPNFYDDSDVQRVPGMSLGKDSSVAVLPGDILYTMSGTIGYAAVYPEVGELASCSNTIARGRVLDSRECDPYYVSLFLNSSLGRSQSLRLVSGGVLGHVMPNPVKRLKILLPNPNVQQSLGAKLRKSERLRRYYIAIMRQVRTELTNVLGVPDAASTKAQTRWEANWIAPSSRLHRIDAEFYRQSFVENEALLLRTGKTTRLGDLVSADSPITNGIRGPEIADSENRMLRLQDVDELWLDSSRSLRVSERQYHENRRAWCLPGDILLATGGYIGVVGKVVDKESQTMGQHSARLRFDEAKVDRDFMLAFFSSARGALLCRRYVTGGVQAGINLEDVREIRLPLPALGQQRRVGDLMRSAERHKKESKDLCHAAVSDLEALLSGNLDSDLLIEEGRDIESWLENNPLELN